MNYQKKTVWSSQMRLSLYLQNKMTMNNMKKTYHLHYGTYTLVQVHVILKTLVYENKLSNILKMYFFTEAL